jgi:hypothetical protein
MQSPKSLAFPADPSGSSTETGTGLSPEARKGDRRMPQTQSRLAEEVLEDHLRESKEGSVDDARSCKKATRSGGGR